MTGQAKELHRYDMQRRGFERRSLEESSKGNVVNRQDTSGCGNDMRGRAVAMWSQAMEKKSID